jgi:hypothetical protein
MTALPDDQIEQVINRIATRLEAYGPTQPNWMLHRTIASIMRGCQHAEPWAEGRTNCGCPRQSIQGITDTLKLGYQLPSWAAEPPDASADYGDYDSGLSRPVRIHIDGEAISWAFTSRDAGDPYHRLRTEAARLTDVAGEPSVPVDAEDPRAPIDDGTAELAHRLDEENLELRQQLGRMAEDVERLTVEQDRLRGLLAEARRDRRAAIDDLTRLTDALKGTRNA